MLPLTKRPSDIAYMAYFAALFLGVVLVDGQVVFKGRFYPAFLRDFWISSSKSLQHPLQLAGIEGHAEFYRVGIMGPALFLVAPLALFLMRGLFRGLWGTRFDVQRTSWG